MLVSLRDDDPNNVESWWARSDVWHAAGRRDPCSDCGERPGTYPTCLRGNLCRGCWEAGGRPVVQVYPGDEGLAPYFGPLLEV